MTKKLDGKIAVITGGSEGIGLATAKRFVAEGAYVFITGRRQPELDAAVTEIGFNVTGVQGDVANLANLERLYERSKSRKAGLTFSSPTRASTRPERLARFRRPTSTSYSTSMYAACFFPCRKHCR